MDRKLEWIHQMHVSFLLTDIDHFKKINDTHGHPTGDQVLRRVAAILKARARKIGSLAEPRSAREPQ